LACKHGFTDSCGPGNHEAAGFLGEKAGNKVLAFVCLVDETWIGGGTIPEQLLVYLEGRSTQLKVPVHIALFCAQIVLRMHKQLEKGCLTAPVANLYRKLCTLEAGLNLRALHPEFSIEGFSEGEHSGIRYFFVFLDADNMLRTRIQKHTRCMLRVTICHEYEV